MGMNLFVLGNSSALNFFDFFDGDYVDSVRVVNISVRVGAGDDFRAELLRFLNRVSCHVSGAAHRYDFILQADIFCVQHIFDEVQKSVAGRFRSRQTSAVSQTFSGENRRVVCVTDSLVLSEKVADFTSAHADVAGRNVNMRTDVTIKFSHERLTKSHNLVVGFSFRIKIGAAFAAADGKTRQGIFENLLERKEFQNTEVDARMKTQAAFVRSDCRIHLHAVAAIDVSYIFIVLPSHAESYDAIRLNHAFQHFFRFVLRILFEERDNRSQNFFNRVVKFHLVGVTLFNQCENIFNIIFHFRHIKSSLLCEILPDYNFFV